MAVDLTIATVSGDTLQILLMRREDVEMVGDSWAVLCRFVQKGTALVNTVVLFMSQKIGPTEAQSLQAVVSGRESLMIK